MTDIPTEKIIGRNEPCPCNSGKKYKRCCGVGAAPKMSAPKAMSPGGSMPGFPGGMSPEQMSGMKDQFDPQMMLQFSQMLGKLPKGQLQKLQGIMQKAMAGKDVTREARDLEDSLPLELQTMLQSFQMPGQMPGQIPGQTPGTSAGLSDEMPTGMSEDEARKIVEAAAKEGKISSDQADSLLKDGPTTGESKAGISKLWKKISGK